MPITDRTHIERTLLVANKDWTCECFGKRGINLHLVPSLKYLIIETVNKLFAEPLAQFIAQHKDFGPIQEGPIKILMYRGGRAS